MASEEIRTNLSASIEALVKWVNQFLQILLPSEDHIVETDRLVDVIADHSLELPDPTALLRNIPIDETMDPLDLPTIESLLDHLDLCMRLAERHTVPNWRKNSNIDFRRYGQTGIVLYALKIRVVNVTLQRFFGEIGVLNRPEDAHKPIQICVSPLDPERMIEIRFPQSAPFTVTIFHLNIYHRLNRLLGRATTPAAHPISPQPSPYSQDPSRPPTPEQLALLKETLDSR